MMVALVLLLPLAADAVRSLPVTDLPATELPVNYSAYLQAFDLVERRQKDSVDLRRAREEAFWKRHALASQQNALPHARWRAAASHLFDATEEEMQQMMGYKPSTVSRRQAVTFLSTRDEALNLSINGHLLLPEDMDWRRHVTHSNRVRTQGMCGSCWAISSTNALEMHLELAEPKSAEGPLAMEEVVTCTPNRRHCGGQGGCTGATAELAFQFVKENGLSFESDRATSCRPSTGKRLISGGFVRLTPNQALPLQYALALKGPVVVSADASGWEIYDGGIFDGCSRNAAVNHAVLAVGYGKSPEGLYWTIRNSWGPSWGEAGHMRLLRTKDDGAHCGTDYHPQEGVACEGETKPVRVCGMCGILFDSSFPVGVAVSNSKTAAGGSAMKLRASKL